MFEFLKKINLGNVKNNSEKKDKDVITNNKSVYYVADRSVHQIINGWMENEHIDKITFGELLYKLGFDPEKKLFFKIIPTNEKKIILSYGYEENVFGNETLELDLIRTYISLRSYRADAYKIYLLSDNKNIIYRISADNSLEDGINLKKIVDYVKEEIDGKTYIRSINEDGITIVIKNNDDDNISLEYLKSNLLEVNNEQELKEYLLSVDDKVSLRSIYKKICEISLGNEEEYDKIDLSFKKNNKIIESILLKVKGNCSMFGPRYHYEVFENGDKICFYMTLPEKTLYCDENTRVIEVKKKGYRVEIKLSSVGTKEEFTKMLVLRDYLMNLEFPVKIDELCNDICARCLIDINSIPYFRIECYCKNEFTDSLLIKQGKLNDFHMTIDGNTLVVDEDGMFYYQSNSLKGEIEVDMDMSKDVVTRYEVYFDNGIESEDMANSMYSAIREAKDAKVRTRKLFDDMFHRNND